MLQLTMLLCSIPAGGYCRSTRQAIVLLATIFIVVLAVQSVVVTSSANDGLPLAYWLVQVATLAGAAVLLRLGLSLRARRFRHTAAR